MENFWDLRYSQPAYAYGEYPNMYLEGRLAGLPAGKILLPAEGEGRNAVYAASLGWEVYAFDSSAEGKKKADRLAGEKQVHIDYVTADAGSVAYPESSFDVIALIFAHFPEDRRRNFHRRLVRFLKPGGLLILEAFGKGHQVNQRINARAGGPEDPAMLYDVETLKADFAGLDFMEAEETVTELQEGLFHIGKADVVRVLAVKSGK